MNLEENPAIQPAQNTGIQLDIPLPGKFEGANSPQQAELWPKWLKRFERYRVASGLKNKPNADQVSILLYSIENCADEQISSQIDVPYSGHNGENCADEKISSQIDVPYSGHNGENCADEQISAQIDVPYSGHNGENCADEQISAQIDVPYLGRNGENCADEQISAQIDVPYSGHNGENCADEQISAQIDVPFLGYVGAKCDAELLKIEVNGHATKFKLDTGAGVSVVSDRETWLQSEPLLMTKQTLRGPGGTLLPVKGVIKARLRHRNKSLDELVYVIRNQEYSLLSRRACVGLDLVARVDNVQENMSDKPNFRAEFGSLFKGIGRLKTASHHDMCRRNTGLSVHRTEDRTSPSSTNQIGDRVHGATGNHFACDRSNQVVLRHGSGAEGKRYSEDLLRSYSSKQIGAGRSTPSVVGRWKPSKIKQ